ncbi:MAG: PHP domain-containing protein [Spirochaetaceae bacterium]|jgi:hypothetical protein|nr:PHP domain-containing protein [Spirochaetaceae bacterium]
MIVSDPYSILNDPRVSKNERLEALKTLAAERAGASGGVSRELKSEINNHIHTIYSFSPYTPGMAALRSREAGLGAAGSVDHDSIAAAEEMLAACEILALGGCVGFEVRVSFKTGADGKPGPFAGRKINNPDSEGIAYMTVQGIPRQQLTRVGEFLDPIRAERLIRTKNMAAAAGTFLAEAGLPPLDFQADIVDKSQYKAGGEITERHLLAAVAEKFIQQYGKGPGIVEGLKTKLGVEPPPKIRAYLADPGNPHYLFDLLGILKSSFLPRIFIQPGEGECIPAKKVCDFAAAVGGIPAYAYLGDVGESPTGDKKAEKFEDEFLDELFATLSGLGFRAITYMPPRNTVEQLSRLQRLCGEWGFMEISGVDINSSRQSFNCPEVLESPFRHLIDTTWALIAHERLSSVEGSFGLFHPGNPLVSAPLAARLSAYAKAGRELDLRRPEESAKKIIEGFQNQRLKGCLDIRP